MQDEEIIELYFKRSESAIRETEQKYSAYCHAIADHILHSKEDSEECVNDTWMKAWNTIPPARPAHLKLYLAKITRSLSFNRYKEKHAQKRGSGQLAEVLDELGECLQGSQDVEAEYLAQELRAAINDFVRALPRQEQTLFIRRYFFVESVSQIAAYCGLTENNVRVRLYRSRKRLKQRLEKEGYIL